MAGNAAPIYSRVGAMGANSFPSGANTIITQIVSDYTGTGANNFTLFTSDATNGGFVQRVRFKATGTNAVSVARIYINNGGTSTAANNWLYGEISLPATTGSTTAATVDVDYPMNVAMPPNYKVLCGISAAATLVGGWAVSVVGGAY